MTLVETTCAMFILGVAITAFVHMVSTIAMQRRLADRQMLAAEEAANLMEEVFAMSWSEITDENLTGLSLSETLQKQGGNPTLSVSVQLQPSPPASKEIRISIDWDEPGGGRSIPVQLIAWRYRSKETSQ